MLVLIPLRSGMADAVDTDAAGSSSSSSGTPARARRRLRFALLAERETFLNEGATSCAETGICEGMMPCVKNGCSRISIRLGRSSGTGVRMAAMRFWASGEIGRSGGNSYLLSRMRL